MMRSAIWRLFFSIIIMWPLPLMPSAGRYMNLAVPPAPLMAATESLQSLRRSSLLGPFEPVGARLRMHQHHGWTDPVQKRAQRLHGIGAATGQHGLGIGHELSEIL